MDLNGEIDRMAKIANTKAASTWIDEVEHMKKIPEQFDMTWNEYISLTCLADDGVPGSRKAILLAYSLGYLRSRQARKYESKRKTVFSRLLRKGE